MLRSGPSPAGTPLAVGASEGRQTIVRPPGVVLGAFLARNDARTHLDMTTRAPGSRVVHRLLRRVALGMVVRNGRILASQCWIRLQLVSFDQRHSGGLTSPGRRDLRLSSRR